MTSLPLRVTASDAAPSADSDPSHRKCGCLRAGPPREGSCVSVAVSAAAAARKLGPHPVYQAG